MRPDMKQRSSARQTKWHQQPSDIQRIRHLAQHQVQLIQNRRQGLLRGCVQQPWRRQCRQRGQSLRKGQRLYTASWQGGSVGAANLRSVCHGRAVKTGHRFQFSTSHAGNRRTPHMEAAGLQTVPVQLAGRGFCRPGVCPPALELMSAQPASAALPAAAIAGTPTEQGSLPSPPCRTTSSPGNNLTVDLGEWPQGQTAPACTQRLRQHNTPVCAEL